MLFVDVAGCFQIQAYKALVSSVFKSIRKQDKAIFMQVKVFVFSSKVHPILTDFVTVPLKYAISWCTYLLFFVNNKKSHPLWSGFVVSVIERDELISSCFPSAFGNGS
jgi:hypothetical protein